MVERNIPSKLSLSEELALIIRTQDRGNVWSSGLAAWWDTIASWIVGMPWAEMIDKEVMLQEKRDALAMTAFVFALWGGREVDCGKAINRPVWNELVRLRAQTAEQRVNSKSFFAQLVGRIDSINKLIIVKRAPPKKKDFEVLLVTSERYLKTSLCWFPDSLASVLTSTSLRFRACWLNVLAEQMPALVGQDVWQEADKRLRFLCRERESNPQPVA